MTADGYLVMTAVGTDVARRPIIGKSLSPWLPLRQSAADHRRLLFTCKDGSGFCSVIYYYYYYLYYRAVVNGPVGPAMAGKLYFFFFYKIFWRNNNRAGNFFDIIFETETTQSPKCAL